MLLKRQFTVACLLGLVSTWSIDVWSADNKALEEIIVQAQKRTETQQEVPASFNVYSEASLESAGRDNITDIAHTVPSIEVISVTKTRTTLFIRSIGTNKFDIGTEGSVGVFVDGVYVPRFSSLMLDNDRISFDILEQHVTQNSKTWSEEFKIFSESRVKVSAKAHARKSR